MSNLSTQVDNLKQKYRKIFLEVSEEFSQTLEKINPQDVPAVLNEILKGAWTDWVELLKKRENSNCFGCAACCKLAVSEFSPDELTEKAQNNDNFATQFLSVFVPYQSEDEAKSIYPEYFELLKEKAAGEKVYFYHCPKVTQCNRCPDYENRPQICKDFPDNPLAFLPKTCGFKDWKTGAENDALKIQSKIEIVGFYKQRLKESE